MCLLLIATPLASSSASGTERCWGSACGEQEERKRLHRTQPCSFHPQSYPYAHSWFSNSALQQGDSFCHFYFFFLTAVGSMVRVLCLKPHIYQVSSAGFDSQWFSCQKLFPVYQLPPRKNPLVWGCRWLLREVNAGPNEAVLSKHVRTVRRLVQQEGWVAPGLTRKAFLAGNDSIRIRTGISGRGNAYIKWRQ